ncbi:MAG: putative glycoside hydrolase [bacterium]|nr:putative glycoside hydrolase [bacterium]
MKNYKFIILTLFSLILAITLGLLINTLADSSSIDSSLYTKSNTVVVVNIPPKPEPPRHLPTPKPLRAIYMSSWVAGSPDFRDKVIKIADETEINSIVVDVKDSTGVVSFLMDDPLIKKINPFEDRIPDIDKFITKLHDKNIYVIARVAVFEDPILAKARPDLAVKRRSDGKTWKDRKGLSWTDMGSKEVWDYNIAVAKGAYEAGFDEINFDYIRFPSDGDMNDIAYTSLEGKKLNRPEELRIFFHYLNEKMKEKDIPISADLFGMTTTNTDDLNIGQVLENAIPYFDYISPMVYPSHYPNNFNGYKNPAAVPYELIKFVMGQGVNRMIAASSSPDKLRPWLQDFNLGAVYTADLVRAQIKATYDVGLSSWMLWSPSNKYTVGALEK